MAKKKGGKPNRHRLLVYHELGQRLRTPPLLIALMGLMLLGIGWLGSNNILAANNPLLNSIWDRRIFIYIMIIVSGGLYIFTIFMGRRSFVEVTPRALRVQGGLVRMDFSYRRIRSLRLVNIESQYPVRQLKSRDYALIEPFLKYTCVGIDLKSWPWPGERWLRQLWIKFLFLGQKSTGLLFIVEEAMILNTQITAAQQRSLEASKKQTYSDPIDRAFEGRRK